MKRRILAFVTASLVVGMMVAPTPAFASPHHRHHHQPSMMNMMMNMMMIMMNMMMFMMNKMKILWSLKMQKYKTKKTKTIPHTTT